MHFDGSRHCGAIPFTAEIDPSTVMLCHCAPWLQELSAIPRAPEQQAPAGVQVSIRGEAAVAEQSIRFDDGAAYERVMGRWSRLAGDVFLAQVS